MGNSDSSSNDNSSGTPEYKFDGPPQCVKDACDERLKSVDMPDSPPSPPRGGGSAGFSGGSGGFSGGNAMAWHK